MVVQVHILQELQMQALDINGLSICQSEKKELNNNAFPLYIWYFDDFICFRNVI